MDILNVKIAEAWEKLNSIWMKMGYDDEGLLRRRKTVVMHVSVSVKNFKLLVLIHVTCMGF